MIDTEELRELVAAWDDSVDGESMKSRELILQILDHTAEPYSRHQYQPGHITSTGMVLHPNGSAVLLVHHRRLNRWLLPGGHIETEDHPLFQPRIKSLPHSSFTICVARSAATLGMRPRELPSK